MQGISGADRQSLSENVRRLRKSRGLNQRNLAKAAGVSLPAIRNIETGRVEPRADTLRMLAAALDATVFDLLRPVLVPQAVRFRAKRKLRTRNEVLSDVAKWLENYRELEQLAGVHASRPFLDEVWRNVASFDDPRQRAKEAARAIRIQWKLDPHEPVRNICGLFDRRGVKVLSLPKESSEFFGLSVGQEDGGPAVVVNTWDRITVERWIFSAAHELGHLILHHEAFNVNEIKEDQDEEKEADIFAAHFLMPNEAFEDELKSLWGLDLLDMVFALKRIFKVSWKTVVVRLQESGMADRSAWPLFYTKFKNRFGYSLSGSMEPSPLHADDYAPAQNEPENLRSADFPANQLSSLVRKALEHGKISMGRAAEIMNLDIIGMRQLAKEWRIRPVSA